MYCRRAIYSLLGPCLLCKGFVNSKQHQSVRVDDDYSYYNDYEVMKVRRRGRQNAAWRPRRRGRGHRTSGTRSTRAINKPTQYLLLSTASILLLTSTVSTV